MTEQKTKSVVARIGDSDWRWIRHTGFVGLNYRESSGLRYEWTIYKSSSKYILYRDGRWVGSFKLLRSAAKVVDLIENG